MFSKCVKICCGLFVVIACLIGGLRLAQAQNASKQTTGYALKKPVFGGACRTCPWGAMGEIVKKAMSFYGWDVQVCYGCAGGPREARMVAGAMMATAPSNPADPVHGGGPNPNGPVDFGSTTEHFLWWAYQGVHDFAKDKEGPRKDLRLVANIQEPSYMIAAVRADSGITDLHQIREKRMPVKIMASTGIGGMITTEILEYYGLQKESLQAQKAELQTNTAVENRKSLDVIIGWGGLENAPEYNMWYEVSQKYDLRYLKLDDALLDKLVKEYDAERRDIPTGLLRGIENPIPSVSRTGNSVYGRADMPDEFAYTLAEALDEHQELLQYSNSGMNFSYNIHTIWKLKSVPLHPGAARYYKEKGYMK